MGPAQIDELLLAWDERLRRMNENLVALESEAVYQVLAGKAGRRAALEGVTKDRVGPALDAVTELFEDRERLGAVVDEAKELRAAMSALAFWANDDKMAEIERLLCGPSIALGQQVVALSDRNLLDQGSRDILIEPEQLLAQMVERFERARTTLVAVSGAWASLDAEVARIEEELTSQRALAAELCPGTGEPVTEPQELAFVEAELPRLRGRLVKDPLGAQGVVERQLLPRLSASRRRLEGELAARERARGALDDARALHRRLVEEHARAVRLLGEARAELDGPSVRGLPSAIDGGLLLGLEEWLHKLEGTVEARRFGPADVGLGRFRESVLAQRETDVRAAAEAEALLARRGELMGRLSARRAQAAALARRGIVVDPAAEVHARGAEALLRRRPVPIDLAARAVERYEAAVVTAARRSV